MHTNTEEEKLVIYTKVEQPWIIYPKLSVYW
jgi:hypothetical protein